MAVASPVRSPADLDRVIADIGHGAFIALGGYHDYRHPLALVRAIVRAGLRNLTVLAPSGSIDVDLLVGVGAVKRLIGGRVAFGILGLAPNFRRAMEQGRLEFVEVDNVVIMRGLEASYRKVPYVPARALAGSDLLPLSPGEPFQFGGETLLKVAPLRPDVSLVHVPWTDRRGNLQVRGEYYDVELVKGAESSIVSTDALVSTARLEQQAATTVPRYSRGWVRAIFELPYGAHPTSCYPHYVHDVRHLLEYLETAEQGRFANYVERYVTGAASDETTYWQAICGTNRRGLLAALARRGIEIAESDGRAQLSIVQGG